VSFFNPFRRAAAEEAQGQIQIAVKWGRERWVRGRLYPPPWHTDPCTRFNIPIPRPSTTPLSQLLTTLASQTSLPLDQLKLVYKGAVLKDPLLTLSSYGIKDGSILVLIGQSGSVPSGAPSSSSAPTPAPASAPKKKKQPETTSEPVLVSYIQSLVNGLLDPLRPSVATFVSQADPRSTNKPAHIPKFDLLQKEHARLSEMLLRGLLDLDGVEIPSGWNDARKERKEGVRVVQQMLNRIDEVWGERRKLGA
jgi:hypothetical protein